ncbi:protein kinase domain-containing protein [Neobacillus bataviensis]|uniref:protein kinase domain-containing protein n=1 Tax=Neobacillus bataviensis TaxID=220685 RepID=UPI001CBC594E|nr:protein kinase [Neobacillus bataviensis]
MKENLIGTTIFDTTGRRYVIEKQIGEGAQGIVYESSDGFIIKKNHTNKESRGELTKRYKWIINQRVPKEARMVTPIAILSEPHTGYVMKKVKGHVPLAKLINVSTKVPFGEWYNVLTGGLKKRLEISTSLSKCFRNLHIHGLCYCDISPNNILVAMKAKSIVLIDPDNLTSTGTFKNTILGTPRYIAPELFMGANQPNSLTDTYSFAVILFELLRLGHPLLGDDILENTPEVEEHALKGNAVYVDHPEDASNRNTRILPAQFAFTEELKSLFERTFVDGLHDSTKRPTISEFRVACQQAEDLLMTCKNPDCSATFYYQADKALECPWCLKEFDKPYRFTCTEAITVKDSQFEDGKLPIPEKMTGELVLKEGFNLLCKRHFEPFTAIDGEEKVAAIELTDKQEIKIHNLQADIIIIFNKVTRQKKNIGQKQTSTFNPKEDVIIYNRVTDLKGINDIFESCSVLNYGMISS